MIKTLSDRMLPYVTADTGFIEQAIMLKNLPTFFTSHMKEHELIALGPTHNVSTRINAVKDDHDSDIQIHAVTRSRSTRNGRTPTTPSRRPYRPPPQDVSDDEDNTTSEPPKGNKFCEACGTYGHLEDKCPLAGKVLHIQEWVKQLDPKQRKLFLHNYKKNRIMTHQRYLEGKRARKHLKMRINAIEIEHESHIPLPAPSILNAKVERAIVDARTENPDIDFGSMDLAYRDFKEPEIDMDTFLEDVDLDLE